MIITSEHIQLLDKAEVLVDKILNSKVTKEYRQAYYLLKNDDKAQRLIKEFNKMKLLYDDVERFGSYHPDYQEIMVKVRQAKRNMDLYGAVANFKIHERNMQKLLDEVSSIIAGGVSERIIVPMDDALFTDTGCGPGGCGTGGSCGCQVS